MRLPLLLYTLYTTPVPMRSVTPLPVPTLCLFGVVANVAAPPKLVRGVLPELMRLGFTAIEPRVAMPAWFPSLSKVLSRKSVEAEETTDVIVEGALLALVFMGMNVLLCVPFCVPLCVLLCVSLFVFVFASTAVLMRGRFARTGVVVTLGLVLPAMSDFDPRRLPYRLVCRLTRGLP